MNKTKQFLKAFTDVFTFGDKDEWDRYGEGYGIGNYILRFALIMFMFNVALLLISIPISSEIVQTYYVFLLFLKVNYFVFVLGIMLRLIDYAFNMIPLQVKFKYWFKKTIFFCMFLFVTYFVNVFFTLIHASVEHNLINSGFDLSGHDIVSMSVEFVSQWIMLMNLQEALINVAIVILVITLIATIIKYLNNKKK